MLPDFDEAPPDHVKCFTRQPVRNSCFMHIPSARLLGQETPADRPRYWASRAYRAISSLRGEAIMTPEL